MLEKTFVTRLKQYYENEGYLVRREIGAGYGVSDLVLVNLDKPKCRLRKKNRQYDPLLKESYFNILKYIPDFQMDKKTKPVNTEFLSNATNISISTIKYSLLKELLDLGYIKEEKRGYYFKINGWLPIAKDVIAIEAKMKNWKRGIYQAARYRSFADQVYLAVPPEIEHLIDKKLLKKVNVGLLVFDPEKETNKNSLPSQILNPTYREKRNFVSEFFWQLV
ncbi:MAG: hypothetical protein ABH837_01905 [bacterium]